MCNKFLAHEYRVLLSANLHISDFSIKINTKIPFMNILNSTGPNIDPWGIPRKTSDQLLYVDPILVLCFVQLR